MNGTDAQQSGDSSNDTTHSLTLRQRLLSREVVFYIWLPAGIGLFMGATQAGRSSAWPLAFGLSYFVTVCCVDWWLVDSGCRLFKAALKTWSPPLWLVLLGGSVFAAYIFVKPANWAIIQLWQAMLPAGIPAADPPPLTIFGRLEELVAGLSPWLLANYLFYRFGQMPRYGYTPTHYGRDNPMASATEQGHDYAAVILKKVRPERRGELLALNAQGHYLRVITANGEDLVLYRFGDAIAEIPGSAGLQVHRSWWISQAAIDSRESASAKQIVLSDGTPVPVSRTFRPELKRRLND